MEGEGKRNGLITLVIIAVLSLLMAADTQGFSGRIVCKNKNTQVVHTDVDLTSMQLSFFSFPRENDAYMTDMECNLEQNVGVGCRVVVQAICALPTTGSRCGDQLTVFKAAFPVPIESMEFCSGMGEETNGLPYTYTQAERLDMQFTTDATDPGAGCSGFLLQDYCVSRKRRDTVSTDSTGQFLIETLKKLPLSKAKTYKERLSLLRIRSGLAKKLAILHTELAEESSSMHSVARRQAGPNDPCNCTSTAGSNCSVLVDQVNVLLALTGVNREIRTAIMCGHHQRREFCFHRYLSRSMLGCNLCPLLRDQMVTHADNPGYMDILVDQFERYCLVAY